MAATSPQPDVGIALREWRGMRRLTQLELALDAGVSTRHLSFVETGRSVPGRETLLRILGRLDVPFREQNRLLLAVGHAPAFPERSLDAPDLAPVRDALDAILARHEPYPAIAVDRAWSLVAANSAVLALTASVEVDPALIEPPVNAVRISLHPDGLAPLIVNLGAWRAFFLERLERQLAIGGGTELADLIDEVRDYPVPGDAGRSPSDLLGPLQLSVPGVGELSFFGMFAIFEAPFEVTTSELAIELLFPADRGTADRMNSLANDKRGGAP